MQKNPFRLHYCAGSVSCLLLGAVGFLLIQNQQELSPCLKNIIALLILNILLLLGMLIRTIIKASQQRYLILTDCVDGIPVKIYEICIPDLLHFCCSEYALEYEIDRWISLRKQLEERAKNAGRDRPVFENCLRQGRALTIQDQSYAVLMEYLQNGKEMKKVVPLWKMPTAADIAIWVIRMNHPQTRIFHTVNELIEWGIHSQKEKRECIESKINEFLRRRRQIS